MFSDEYTHVGHSNGEEEFQENVLGKVVYASNKQNISNG